MLPVKFINNEYSRKAGKFWSHTRHLVYKSVVIVTTILQGSYSSLKTKFPDFPLTFPVTQHSLTYTATHFITERLARHNLWHQHKLSQYVDFTITNDSVFWLLTFVSSTQFACCLMFVQNISSIHSITSTFSTQECSIPYFSLTY